MNQAEEKRYYAALLHDILAHDGESPWLGAKRAAMIEVILAFARNTL